MYLCEALSITSSSDIDPALPLKLGRFELGREAAEEAIRLLDGRASVSRLSQLSRQFDEPMYWSVSHSSEGQAEIFGFPKGFEGTLTTAVEVALVRAVAASLPEQHCLILNGGVEIVLGSENVVHDFQKILAIVSRPLAGDSILFGNATIAIVNEDIRDRLSSVALSCLENSFRTSPLKFRFLELYRLLEARFLSDVKTKLFATFDAGPSAALGEATEALKSEMKQIMGLANTEVAGFEACWARLDELKDKNNRFACAVFRRVGEKRITTKNRAEIGAALIYQIRCSIVHSAEKDLIFENHTDSEAVLQYLIPAVEETVLTLVGLKVT